MSSTWTEDGKRRQARPLVVLRRLYTCTPGRRGVDSLIWDNTWIWLAVQVNDHLRKQPPTPTVVFRARGDSLEPGRET